MDDKEEKKSIFHAGVLGMKWGRRKTTSVRGQTVDRKLSVRGKSTPIKPNAPKQVRGFDKMYIQKMYGKKISDISPEQIAKGKKETSAIKKIMAATLVVAVAPGLIKIGANMVGRALVNKEFADGMKGALAIARAGVRP